ncbi:MAG TPA: hypothetical protein VK272_13665 [Solirubrobacteraceae bacterium]|nr:hypothetical protein [Solirubrobacteraceae bacterium]
MSISPVGGLAAAATAVNALAKPESTEAHGAADHDGDADNALVKGAPAANAAATPKPSTGAAGRVDVSA